MATNTRKIPRLGNGKLRPCIPLLKLSFIQNSWGFDNVDLRDLMMGFEPFMVKVGLYGNTMDYDYKVYLILAMNNTRFKNVCELARYFKIQLVFHSEYNLHPTQQGNRSLMSEFFCIGYRQMKLGSSNIMQMHKNGHPPFGYCDVR
jgi:hypothetical protein